MFGLDSILSFLWIGIFVISLFFGCIACVFSCYGLLTQKTLGKNGSEIKGKTHDSRSLGREMEQNLFINILKGLAIEMSVATLAVGFLFSIYWFLDFCFREKH